MENTDDFLSLNQYHLCVCVCVCESECEWIDCFLPSGLSALSRFLFCEEDRGRSMGR